MNSHKKIRKFKNFLFLGLITLASIVVLIPLILIVKYIFTMGANSLNLDFFTQLPKPVGEVGGGMKHAIIGTLYVVILGALIAVPLGTACGIFLSEFGKGFIANSLRYTIDLLTGVPSIVIGVFAYAVVVVPLHGFSAFAGAIALGIIILPTVTRTTEEILKLIPQHVREAGLALGLPRWKVILFIVLRGSLSGLITGVMLAISRAAGETAPLLFTAFGNMFLSFRLMEPMATLPVQIYTYATSPFDDWKRQAWAGAFVLIILVLGTNLMTRFLLAYKSKRPTLFHRIKK